MHRYIFFIFFWFVLALPGIAQKEKVWGPDDLKPLKNYEKQCEKFQTIRQKAPKESHFGLFVRGGHLFLQVSDRRYFISIISEKTDGIAIDIISRDQFACGGETPYRGQDDFLGESWKILFQEDLFEMENLSVNDNKVVFDLGSLPEGFSEASHECNLMLIQKRVICDYQKYLNIEAQYWKLLDMGLFKDSIKVEHTGDIVTLNDKVLEFSINYKKNDATISEHDLQPIYDSLDFTDYDIVSINIVAFASVEGGRSLNEQLMKRRSKSVVDALQRFQTPEIIYQVDALENWDQFYADIRRTRYRHIADMEKPAVKKLLAGNETMLSKLEPILARHRKAVLKIYMTRKVKVESLSNQELISVFNTAVKKEEVNRVMLLLDYVLDKFKAEENPESLTEQLDIPLDSRYSPLYNNLAGFEYDEELVSEKEAERVFEELYNIFPHNEQILYNLVAVKLERLRKRVNKQDMQALRELMNRLQVSSLAPSLKYRPWINYYILTNEYYQQINDFVSSRQAIKNILSIYKNVLTDEDRLSIAKYMATYSQYDQAEQMMRPVIEKEEIPAELLFFYLNITMPFKKYNQKSNFSELVAQATRVDRDRFCAFFRSSADGGISFQMLQNPRLKEVYCQSCTNNSQ